MKIGITGSSGLIGSNLLTFLRGQDHTVYKLVRKEPYRSKDEIHFNHTDKKFNANAMNGLDAVIHLSGFSLSEKWTPKNKEIMVDSRVNSTKFLCENLVQLENPPNVLICASAVGIYGDRGDEVLTENSSPGDDWMAGLCREWEAATQSAREKGIRVVNARTGVVLHIDNPFLAKQLPIFKMGLGGKMADGSQYLSWISTADILRAFSFILDNDISGPVNLSSPNPVTNAEFTKIFAGILNRPALFTVPAFAVKAMFGEMGEALILGGNRVVPDVLSRSGFAFEHPDLKDALETALGK
ncbi:MAG TPA: TIGR01777 family oxidoreductase [bacterium]|jgi:hypothetical protein